MCLGEWVVGCCGDVYPGVHESMCVLGRVWVVWVGVGVFGWVDGWVGGRLGVWVGGRVDGWMGGCARVHACVWVNGWVPVLCQ